MSKEPPKLWIVQAMWGMVGLPSATGEWTTQEKLARIREAGFDAIDLDIPLVVGKESYWEDLLARHQLSLGLQCPFVHSVAELEGFIATVKRMRSPYLDAQVGHSFIPESQACELLRAMTETARRHDVKLLVQTHRGRVTQDLLRTVEYCRAIPELRLNLDLSHYFLTNELTDEPLRPEAAAAFDVLLRHTSMIDARVSNGHQIQVDIGRQGEALPVGNFIDLWRQAMRNWLATAEPGDIFIFRPELGPPPYSMVDLEGQEISDRWSQAVLLAQIGRRLWDEVKK